MFVTRSRQVLALCAALVLLPAALTACGMYSPVEPDSAETFVPEDEDAPSDEDRRNDATRPRQITTPFPAPDRSVGYRPDDGAQVNAGSSGEGSDGGSSGSGGSSPPSGTSGSGTPGSGGTVGSGGSGGGTGAPPPIPTIYVFALPQSDTSVTGNDGPAYGSLRLSCASAISLLRNTSNDFMFQFNTPRFTAMYTAGLAHCLGHTAIGIAITTGALKVYGTNGLNRLDVDDQGNRIDPEPLPLGYGEPVCDLYRTLVSVRDQVDPATLSCSAPGSTPGWSYTTQGPDLIMDDPCTFSVDESTLTYTGPSPAPNSFCGPVTPDSLILASTDPSTLFAGWTVDATTGELVPPVASLASSAAPPVEEANELAAVAASSLPFDDPAPGAPAGDEPPGTALVGADPGAIAPAAEKSVIEYAAAEQTPETAIEDAPAITAAPSAVAVQHPAPDSVALEAQEIAQD